MISVIVPVFNTAAYLSYCIESILDQNMYDIEIILIDDGSTDESVSICDSYSHLYKNIKTIHQENKGLSEARNVGIKNSNGEYITFVDSDDMLAPNFLNAALELIEEYHADFVSFSHCRCDKNDMKIDKFENISKADINVYRDSYDKMEAYLEKKDIGTVAWGKLYGRELFDSICYPAGRLHEDVFTTYKVVDRAGTIVTTSQVGYIYRNNPSGITLSKFNEKRLDIVEGKLEQLEFISNHYPLLKKGAEKGVIYACNQCLMKMAKSNYNDENVLKNFQVLYKKYGKSYLNSNVSIKGKILALIARVNVYLAKNILNYM